MSFDVYLPFVASALFGIFGVRLSRWLRPAQATWLLSCGALVTAACTTCSLLLLAGALLGRFSVIASIGDWSATVFRRHDPVSVSVSVVAIAVLVVLFASTCRALTRHVRELVRSYRTCRCLPPSAGELVVVADDAFQVRALPGRPGRVVVSTKALSTLSAAERAAVLAHERSHLVHRHHLHRLAVAVAVAAAANPLLRAAPRATSLAVERWADEDASRVRTPEAVASALRQAARGREPALRIKALRKSRGHRGWLVLPIFAVSFVGLVLTSVEATRDAGQLAHRADVPASASGSASASASHQAKRPSWVEIVQGTWRTAERRIDDVR